MEDRFGLRTSDFFRIPDFELRISSLIGILSRVANRDPQPKTAENNAFPATHWSLIQAVKSGGAPAEAALSELCRHYWFPIYAFIRRQGYHREDAEDLTQGFFATMLADQSLLRAVPERGRLRTFLLHVLQEFLADYHRHTSRQKRGGGVEHVPLAFEEGEQRYVAKLTDQRDPETLFHRAWAQQVLAEAQTRLGASYAAVGKSDLLRGILPHLEGDDAAVSYRDLAQRLQTTETALRLTVFRARQKLRSLIEEEIHRTASDATEAGEELNWLFKTLVDGR